MPNPERCIFNVFEVESGQQEMDGNMASAWF